MALTSNKEVLAWGHSPPLLCPKAKTKIKITDMEINDLLLFIKIEHQRLMKLYGSKENSQIKYPMVVKIMEELGELNERVLASDSMQRAEKIEAQKSKIDEENADVLITVLLLAENMGIDIVDSLKRKIEKIKNRNY